MSANPAAAIPRTRFIARSAAKASTRSVSSLRVPPYSSAMNALSSAWTSSVKRQSTLVKVREGVPTPKEICTCLDDYVIGQNAQARSVGRGAQPLQTAEPSAKPTMSSWRSRTSC